MSETRELQQLFHSCMPLFIALGDDVRLQIIEVLAAAAFSGFQGLNVKQITEKTSLSRPAISHHLKILRDAGLVNIRRSGTCNFYYMTVSNGTRLLSRLGDSLMPLLDQP